MAQWLRHLPTEQGIPGSNPGVIGRIFFSSPLVRTLFLVAVQPIGQGRIVPRIPINTATYRSLDDTGLAIAPCSGRTPQTSSAESNPVYGADSIADRTQTKAYPLEQGKRSQMLLVNHSLTYACFSLNSNHHWVVHGRR